MRHAGHRRRTRQALSTDFASRRRRASRTSHDLVMLTHAAVVALQLSVDSVFQLRRALFSRS
ncbi:MAG: hypothetical protein DLM58_01300 [Pseudonocardiales bacterium]|nr:MAG: hypothetical protein DLM58_01300 [Pseudonocardiales bacterium]